MERCSSRRHRVPDFMPPLDSLHWSHYQAWLVSCRHWMSAYNPWSKSILRNSSLSVPVFTSKQCWVVGVGGPDRWICIGVFLPPSPPFSHSLSNIWFSHRLVYVCIHTHRYPRTFIWKCIRTGVRTGEQFMYAFLQKENIGQLQQNTHNFISTNW